MNDLQVCLWPIDKVIPYARNSRRGKMEAISVRNPLIMSGMGSGFFLIPDIITPPNTTQRHPLMTAVPSTSAMRRPRDGKW